VVPVRAVSVNVHARVVRSVQEDLCTRYVSCLVVRDRARKFLATVIRIWVDGWARTNLYFPLTVQVLFSIVIRWLFIWMTVL